jgi:23S rRNA (adenine2503-C2)-methyltransferase
MKPLIHGLMRDELVAFCAERGQPAFRGRQIWEWLYRRRVDTPGSMTNLPAPFRKALAETFDFEAVRPGSEPGLGWHEGGTRKILLELRDGECVEAVLIPSERYRTVCVSSQVGCAWACAFCASGQAGFVRNLEPGELVGQVLAAGRVAGELPTHVVFMGIGEPLENYDAVLRAIRILNDSDGLALGARRLTLSTCGLAPGIERLAGEGLQVELSVSLHAADDALRSRLMPVNRRYPLAPLLDACARYVQATGRIITFEYAMIRGLNDSEEQAQSLARILARVGGARVNLIPLSAVAEFPGEPATREAIRRFQAVLERAGLNVTVRLSRGLDQKAACGQLRASRKAAAPAVSACRTSSP